MPGECQDSAGDEGTVRWSAKGVRDHLSEVIDDTSWGDVYVSAWVECPDDDQAGLIVEYHGAAFYVNVLALPEIKNTTNHSSELTDT